MLAGVCQESGITVNVPVEAGREIEWPQSWWRSYFLPLICFKLMFQFLKVLTTTLGRTEYDPIVCWESAPSWQEGPTWLHRGATGPTLLSRETGVRLNILVLEQNIMTETIWRKKIFFYLVLWCLKGKNSSLSHQESVTGGKHGGWTSKLSVLTDLEAQSKGSSWKCHGMGF